MFMAKKIGLALLISVGFLGSAFAARYDKTPSGFISQCIEIKSSDVTLPDLISGGGATGSAGKTPKQVESGTKTTADNVKGLTTQERLDVVFAEYQSYRKQLHEKVRVLQQNVAVLSKLSSQINETFNLNVGTMTTVDVSQAQAASTKAKLDFMIAINEEKVFSKLDKFVVKACQ
jgi:hypothetical protein